MLSAKPELCHCFAFDCSEEPACDPRYGAVSSLLGKVFPLSWRFSFRRSLS